MDPIDYLRKDLADLEKKVDKLEEIIARLRETMDSIYVRKEMLESEIKPLRTGFYSALGAAVVAATGAVLGIISK